MFSILLKSLILLIILLKITPLLHSFHILDTSISCDQSNFVLNVRFEEPFYGIIYSEKGFPNCIYVNGSIISKNFYTIKVPLDGCETTYNSDGYLENIIVIQDNRSRMDETDKKFLLTCIPISTTVRSLFKTVNFGAMTVNTQSISTVTVSAIGIVDKHLNYNVELYKANLDGTLQLITSPVHVGDEIIYVIRVNSFATDARIGHCWARDAQSTLQLSDENGCSLQLTSDVWNQFQREEHNNEIVFRNRIKAWAFPTSNDVNIFCNLHVCHSVCRKISCSSPRKRREITIINNDDDNDDDDFKMIRMVQTSFRVENQPKQKIGGMVEVKDRLWIYKDLMKEGKTKLFITLEQSATKTT